MSGDYEFTCKIKHKEKALSSEKNIKFVVHDSLEMGFTNSNLELARILKVADQAKLINQDANLFSILQNISIQHLNFWSFSLLFLGIALFTLR